PTVASRTAPGPRQARWLLAPWQSENRERRRPRQEPWQLPSPSTSCPNPSLLPCFGRVRRPVADRTAQAVHLLRIGFQVLHPDLAALLDFERPFGAFVFVQPHHVKAAANPGTHKVLNHLEPFSLV